MTECSPKFPLYASAPTTSKNTISLAALKKRSQLFVFMFMFLTCILGCGSTVSGLGDEDSKDSNALRPDAQDDSHASDTNTSTDDQGIDSGVFQADSNTSVDTCILQSKSDACYEYFNAYCQRFEECGFGKASDCAQASNIFLCSNRVGAICTSDTQSCTSDWSTSSCDDVKSQSLSLACKYLTSEID
jgi:hypothetical protein